MQRTRRCLCWGKDVPLRQSTLHPREPVCLLTFAVTAAVPTPLSLRLPNVRDLPWHCFTADLHRRGADAAQGSRLSRQWQHEGGK